MPEMDNAPEKGSRRSLITNPAFEEKAVMKLAVLVGEYRDYQVRMATLSETTLKNYLILIREFVRWSNSMSESGVANVPDLSQSAFTRYVDYIAARAPKKCDMMRAAVRSFCRYLIRCKWIDVDITKDVELPSVERSIRTGPGEEVIAKMIATVETMEVSERRRHFYRASLYLLVFAGLRKKELYDMRVEDIRMAEREVFVRLGKGNSPRIVKCPDEFWPVIARYLAQRPAHPGGKLLVYSEQIAIGIDGGAVVLNRIMAAAGLSEETITPHCLRHAFATRAANNNAPLTVVQAQLGHSKITTTAGYIHAPKKITDTEAQYFGRTPEPSAPQIPMPPPTTAPAARPADHQRRRVDLRRMH